jgi:hypothetical protein
MGLFAKWAAGGPSLQMTMSKRAENHDRGDKRTGASISHLRTWRRCHRSGAIAEVMPGASVSGWEACAFSGQRSGMTVNLGRVLTHLVDAQNAADTLARMIAPHACDDSCGSWLPTERRGGHSRMR